MYTELEDDVIANGGEVDSYIEEQQCSLLRLIRWMDEDGVASFDDGWQPV
jgi:hypothetical protein